MTARTAMVLPSDPDLSELLRGLGLRSLADSLDDFISRATRARWSVTQTIEELARLEATERAKRRVDRRLSESHLGRFKPMADFDWDWPRSIDREAIERVLTLSFREKVENVILVAAQGLGKTMIAKNIAYRTALEGDSTLFVSASELLLDLSRQETSRTLNNRLRYYSSPSVLVIDEIGYLSYDNTAADLLFQVVSRRYERKPLVLTTNLSFSDWGTVFPNAACATALIDRLTHHSEIIAIDGESYRKREAEAAKKARNRGNKTAP